MTDDSRPEASIDDEFLADLVRRLTSGESPRQVRQSLLTPPWQETLRRCAVPRTFDDSLYHELLIRADGPALDEVIEAGFAEQVAGSAGLFRLRRGVREEWLDSWPARPEERVPRGVVDLSELLADLYAALDDRLEELYHLAVAEPEPATTLFDELFGEADQRFDLPACQDVLDTLSEPARLGWFGEALADRRADRGAYLGARLFWATDWLQSARYLRRPAVDDRLRALLGDGGPRAIEVSAAGGMGKTMLLRSFIARECVPEPNRIPCARLDFDLVSPSAAAQRPWLLLLEIADQLNRQLRSAPFQEMLNDHGIFRALLDPMPSTAMRAAAGQLASAERVADEVAARFGRILSETVGDRPALLVLDTFEQVLLHPEGDAESILGAMGRLLEAHRSLRLVVAGRYPLRERVDNLDGLIPGLETVPIGPFSAAESRRYLRSRRGLTDDDLIGAMVAKSRGKPFTLALLADLARDQPSLTAQEILAYDDPAVLYLVERIVARIDDPAVRWLLRYGVIPRYLGPEFVKAVMEPYLREGMSGVSPVDAPGDDDLPGGVAESLFPADVLATPDSPLDLDTVWQRLLQYADESSWVNRFADHPNSVLFHPDLVEPLRRVVRKHPVYAQLHRAAAEYCEDRAQNDADNWLPWTLEEIYHRFQLGGPDAVKAWESALDAADLHGGLPARRRVAEELLRSEYVDEDGAPRPFDDGRTIVTWPQLGRAHFEIARVAVALAEQRRAGPSDPMLRRAFAALRHVQRIRDDHGWPAYLDAELARVTATAHRLADDRSAALEVAGQALEHATGDDRVALQEVLADGIREREPERAAGLYREVLDTGPGDPARRRVGWKLISLLGDNDRVNDALAVLGDLPPAPEVTVGEAATLLAEGRLLLRAGRPATLRERARSIGRDSPQLAEARAWCLGAACLAMHQPFPALDEVRGAAKGAVVFRNELSELSAEIEGELLNVPDAFARVEVLCREWMDAGEAERSWRAASLPLEFDLRGTGTLRNHLGYLIFSASGAESRPGSEGWFRHRLGRLRLAIQDGSPGLPALIAETRLALGPEPVPRYAVDLALVMLAVDPDPAVELLMDGLRRMDAGPARLTALTRLRFSPRVPLDAQRQAALDELIDTPRDWTLPVALDWAEYQRVFGDPAMAYTALVAAARMLPSHSSPDAAYQAWQVMDGAQRLGLRPVPAPDVDVSGLRLGEVAPVLAAAIRILQVLRRPEHPAAGDELRLAGAELEAGGGVGSEWEAYLESARSAVAQADGDGTACSTHLTLAERIWDRIHPGVPLPEIAVAEPPEEPLTELSPPSPIAMHLTDWSPSQVVARLTWTHPMIAARFDRPGGTPVTRVGSMRDLLAVEPADLFATQLQTLVNELLERPERFPARLGNLLADGLPVGPSDEPVELAIATRSSLLGAMPWESATLGSAATPLAKHGGVRSLTRVLDGGLAATHTAALLQRALRALGHEVAVDGLYGPDTARAFRDYCATNGRPETLGANEWEMLHRTVRDSASGPPEVLVVRPNAGLEIAQTRGGRGKGIDVAALYERYGFSVKVTQSPGPGEFTEQLRSCVRRGRLAVLHVVGNFGISGNDVYIEFTSSQEATDMGKWVGPRSSAVLASTTFDRPLAALPTSLARPLVVLDPGRPEAYSEAVRQLVLRNAFARHLLELANIPTVLAIGLDRQDASTQRPMIEMLADGRTACEIAGELRNREQATFDLASAAVSSHVPAYAMQRWWTR